jgi:glutamate transport system permease protein
VDSNFRLAVLGLTVYTAAFVCEAVRSGGTPSDGSGRGGPLARPDLQPESRIILLPQAFRAVIIPLGSVLIALTKNTTIASRSGWPRPRC